MSQNLWSESHWIGCLLKQQQNNQHYSEGLLGPRTSLLGVYPSEMKTSVDQKKLKNLYTNVYTRIWDQLNTLWHIYQTDGKLAIKRKEVLILQQHR